MVVILLFSKIQAIAFYFFWLEQSEENIPISKDG